jgi:hypothetical protein
VCSGLQRFIDAVVHDLVDQMVKAFGAGGADVHAGSLPDMFESLQDLDALCRVFVFHWQSR